MTPFREGYTVAMEEQKPAAGIGGIRVTRGIPVEADVAPEPPCRFLVYKESGCKTCGGYVCSVSSDRRIMDAMLEVCISEPAECAIRRNQSE